MTKRHKTLVFHIGDRKTGSTSIQQAFATNKVTLKDRTVFYPARMAHNYLGRIFKAYSKPEHKSAHEKAIASFESIAKKIRKVDADFCLISAEAFEGVDPAVFRDVVDRYFADAADDIRIMGYVRPHGPRVLSSFAERIKNGNPRAMSSTLDTFFAHNNATERFHYLPRFSAWRDQFGDRFLLRPMIRDQLYQKSVVADFVRYGFNRTEFQVAEVSNFNQSLCLEDVMRLKVVQTHHANHPHKLAHALGWEVSRVLDTLPPPKSRTKLRLHTSLAQDIHAAYLADAQAVDQAFFNGVSLLEGELDKARDTAGDTAQSLAPAAWLGEDEIRFLNMLSKIISGITMNDPGKWAALWRANTLSEMHQNHVDGD